jgi:hypothetical protein
MTNPTTGVQPGEDWLPALIDDSTNGSELQPERRLMLAVLKDALLVLRRCHTAEGAWSQRQLRETEEWFASRDMTWPFAFECICEELGLDAERIRAGVRRTWRPRARPLVRARDLAAYFRAYLRGEREADN